MDLTAALQRLLTGVRLRLRRKLWKPNFAGFLLKISTSSNYFLLLLGWCLQLWCSSLRNVHPTTSRSSKAWRTSGACNERCVSWSGAAMPAERAWGETDYAGDNRWTERFRSNFLIAKWTVCNLIEKVVGTSGWKNWKIRNSFAWTFLCWIFGHEEIGLLQGHEKDELIRERLLSS